MSVNCSFRVGHRARIESLEIRRLLSAGDLDTSFSSDGQETTNIGAGFHDAGNDVAVQADGKAVVASAAGLIRYNVNGGLDTTFGAAGTGAVTGVDLVAVAIQSDGKIVAVGTESSSLGNDDYQFVVHRYLSNGAPDPTFSGDGKAVFDYYDFGIFPAFTALQRHHGRQLAVQKDGKILVVGMMFTAGSIFTTSDADFAVVRFNANGSVDTSYGDDGVRFLGFGGSDFAVAAAIDYTGSASSNPHYGKLVVVGSTFSSATGNAIAVARVTTSGAPDSGFSGDGKVIMSQSGKALSAGGLVIQPNGKIVVAGRAALTSSGQGNFIVARFTTSGALDTTFGSGRVGFAEVDMFGDNSATDVFTSFGNKLVVGGQTNGQFGLLVLSKDGVRDDRVGTAGRIFTPFAAGAVLSGLARAPGNKIVAVGTYKSSNISNVAIARYLDFGPTVSLAASDPSVIETGVGDIATFRVSRPDALPISTRVYYSVGGTAAAPGSVSSLLTDYTGIPSTPTLRYIDIPANQTTATIVITPKDDNRDESDETVILTLVGNDSYTNGAQSSGTVTIIDNDTATVGSISGAVYNDLDGDGVKDANETGIAGRTVFIDLDNDSALDANELSTTTNSSGLYTLAGIAPGTHKVRQIRPAGWTQTFPLNNFGLNVTLSAGQNSTGNNFFLRPTPGGAASIAGNVFHDLDRDGIKDAGEGGLNAWTAYLDLDNDSVLDTIEQRVSTDSSGNYLFGNLAAGTYKIRIVLQSGFVQTLPTNNLGNNATLTAGQAGTGEDFGADN